MHSDDPALLALVDELYAPTRVDRPADHALFLGRVRVGRRRGLRSPPPTAGCSCAPRRPGVAFRHLVYEANQMAIDATAAPVRLHAGAVARAGRAVALVGPMGAGKSTLAAGLVVARLRATSPTRWSAIDADGRVRPVREAVLARRAARGADGAGVDTPAGIAPPTSAVSGLVPAAGARRGGATRRSPLGAVVLPELPPGRADRRSPSWRRPTRWSTSARTRSDSRHPGALAALHDVVGGGAVLPAGRAAISPPRATRSSRSLGSARVSAPATGVTDRRARSRSGRDEALVVDGEVVVWREHGIHRLNATAALVWTRCDGATDLDAIARALADGVRAPVDTVRRDVRTRRRRAHDARAGDRDACAPTPIPMIEPPIECTGCGDGPAFGARVLLAVDDGPARRRRRHRARARARGRLRCDGDGGASRRGRTSYGVLLPAAGAGPRAGRRRSATAGPICSPGPGTPSPSSRRWSPRSAPTPCRPAAVLLEAVAVGRAGRVALVAPPANRVAFERAAARHGLATAPGTAVVVARRRRPPCSPGAPWLGVDRDRIARARCATGRTPATALPTLAAG